MVHRVVASGSASGHLAERVRIRMIAGVYLTPLRQIVDERGKIMHMMRADDPGFEQFGEIYFSVVYPGIIKAWHLHRKMTLNYAVVFGRIKLVLYDGRENSSTYKELQEIFLGEEAYQRVTIPPGVWNGFKGIGLTQAIVANCSTLPHDPEEIVRMSPFDPAFGYDWAVKHG